MGKYFFSPAQIKLTVKNRINKSKKKNRNAAPSVQNFFLDKSISFYNSFHPNSLFRHACNHPDAHAPKGLLALSRVAAVWRSASAERTPSRRRTHNRPAVLRPLAADSNASSSSALRDIQE